MKFNKKIGLAFLLMSILGTTQAEYTAKIFIDGVSMGTGGGNGGGSGSGSNLPPSDPTEQTQGDSNFLVKLSRTTAYQGEPVFLTTQNNSEDCYYAQYTNINATNANIIESCVSWGDSLPFSWEITSNLELGVNTINVYQVPTIGNGDTPIKTETLTINVLTPPEEANSDGNLKYTVSRRSLPVAEDVFINFYDNTYDCVGLKHIESNQLVDWGYCGTQADYMYFSPEWALDQMYQSGTQNFAVIGYQADGNGDPIDGTITEYPFSLDIIPEATPPVITEDTYLENRNPFDTFDGVYLGSSTFGENIIVFGLLNADDISVSDVNGYISGSKSVNGGGEVPLRVNSTVSTTVDLTATATNQNGTTTKDFSYFMNKTTIDEIDIKWCRFQAMDGADCDVYQEGLNGSAAIWDGGSGDDFSFVFRVDNAECVTLSSTNDPNYMTPITRCYYDNNSSMFDVSYPNHDPVGRTQKIYNYQLRATNSDGEDFTENFSFRIYYD